MRNTLIAVTAAAGLSLAAFGAIHAQDAMQPGMIMVDQIESGSYMADPNHSMVVWKVNHLGFSDYYGTFGNVSGTLMLNTEDPSASSVDMTIPIASVTVPSEGLKEHLLRPAEDGASADFFGADPMAAHFVSTGVEMTGETSATITGDLTMNGVTKPVTIMAEMSGMGASPMNQKATLGFRGTATIMRSEFNVNYGIDVGVSDEVDLMITAAFEK